MNIFRKRYLQALTDYHFIVCILDPTKRKYKLSSEEEETALKQVESMYSNTRLLPLIIKLRVKSAPFKNIMFNEELLMFLHYSGGLHKKIYQKCQKI